MLELHGTTHEVVCMSCGDVSPREPFQRLLASMNPGVARAVAEMPARRLAQQHAEAEGGAGRASSGDTSPVCSRLSVSPSEVAGQCLHLHAWADMWLNTMKRNCGRTVQEASAFRTVRDQVAFRHCALQKQSWFH